MRVARVVQCIVVILVPFAFHLLICSICYLTNQLAAADSECTTYILGRYSMLFIFIALLLFRMRP